MYVASRSHSREDNNEGAGWFLAFLQYLNEKEYLKGIEVYEEIIRAYSSFSEELKHEEL